MVLPKDWRKLREEAQAAHALPPDPEFAGAVGKFKRVAADALEEHPPVQPGDDEEQHKQYVTASKWASLVSERTSLSHTERLRILCNPVQGVVQCSARPVEWRSSFSAFHAP